MATVEIGTPCPIKLEFTLFSKVFWGTDLVRPTLGIDDGYGR